jgi:hypothetical protein
MPGLNKFGRQRLAFLRSRHPQILKKLEDHGLLQIHLHYAQKRAVWRVDQLVMAGMDVPEAEKIALLEVIQENSI